MLAHGFLPLRSLPPLQHASRVTHWELCPGDDGCVVGGIFFHSGSGLVVDWRHPCNVLAPWLVMAVSQAYQLATPLASSPSQLTSHSNHRAPFGHSAKSVCRSVGHFRYPKGPKLQTPNAICALTAVLTAIIHPISTLGPKLMECNRFCGQRISRHSCAAPFLTMRASAQCPKQLCSTQKAMKETQKSIPNRASY